MKIYHQIIETSNSKQGTTTEILWQKTRGSAFFERGGKSVPTKKEYIQLGQRKIRYQNGKNIDEARSPIARTVSNQEKAEFRQLRTRTTPKESKEDIEANEEEFEVEEILNQRNRNGITEYQIRWKGYNPGNDSWTTHGNPPVTSIVQTTLKNSKNETRKSNGWRGARAEQWSRNSTSIDNSRTTTGPRMLEVPRAPIASKINLELVWANLTRKRGKE